MVEVRLGTTDISIHVAKIYKYEHLRGQRVVVGVDRLHDLELAYVRRGGGGGGGGG